MEALEQSLFCAIHCSTMFHAFYMQKAVDKEVSNRIVAYALGTDDDLARGF